MFLLYETISKKSYHKEQQSRKMEIIDKRLPPYELQRLLNLQDQRFQLSPVKLKIRTHLSSGVVAA
jgi:hypothetical protein